MFVYLHKHTAAWRIWQGLVFFWIVRHKHSKLKDEERFQERNTGKQSRRQQKWSERLKKDCPSYELCSFPGTLCCNNAQFFQLKKTVIQWSCRGYFAKGINIKNSGHSASQQLLFKRPTVSSSELQLTGAGEEWPPVTCRDSWTPPSVQ